MSLDKMSMAWLISVTKTKKKLLQEWHACYSHVDSDWFTQEKPQAKNKKKEKVFSCPEKCIKLKGNENHNSRNNIQTKLFH